MLPRLSRAALFGCLPALAATLVAAPAAHAAARTAAAPRVPRLTVYPATLDISGYIHVKVTKDDTASCAPGQDVVVEFDADVDMGKPRRVTLQVVNGVVSTNFAQRPGRAVHVGRVTSYDETNYCPPSKPVALVAPTCETRRGTLRAWLAPTPSADLGFDDPVPLVHGVSVSLMRSGGGSQDDSCMNYLYSGIEPSVGPHVIDTLEQDQQGIVLPLGATDVRFRRLRRGGSIRRTISLNGACNHVLVSTAPAAGGARSDSSCTVTGRVFVAVKRVG